ncbi:gustatory receptor for sugar taste 64f-like [Macrosteles quadrilineatus]|uniref:gustatory receptor for sugar taste 64f-like n=1 Tax=Macrosteles quadrilineatus TaxID=74068 RepID=UPI0023E32CE3|nr:gustatory receptor for sugar taste 64f-like [Macrosteles quadrilineatus]
MSPVTSSPTKAGRCWYARPFLPVSHHATEKSPYYPPSKFGQDSSDDNNGGKSKVFPVGTTDTFSKSLSWTLLLARIFGLLPVSAKTQATVTSFLAIFGTAGMTLLGLHWCFLNFTVFRATKVVFYGSATLSCVLLHRLGKAWPRLSNVWRHAEVSTKHLGYRPHTTLICRTFTALYCLVAVVEHAFAIINAIVNVYECSARNVFRRFFSRWFPQLLTVLPYTPALTPLVLMLNTLATFTFSFLDLLIFNLAFCLSSMFWAFNRQLVEASKQTISRPRWSDWYRDYNVLRRLVTIVDNHISPIVLLSFIINVYHICLQLYLSLTPLPTLASKAYFCLSFGFLMSRTITVCLASASIHDLAKQPKFVIFSVPSEEFDEEVERFQFQVCNDSVAISAMRFFILTRTTLVTVIGLAATYEVVMFQIQTMAEEETDMKRLSAHNLTTDVCE